MFPLHTKNFPATADALAQLLNESVRQLFVVDRDPVTLETEAYPQLRSLSVSLDHAQLRPNPPRPPEVKGEHLPALSVGELHLNASSLSLGPATADMRLSARDVRLYQGRDAAGEIVLIVQSAADGEVEVSASKSEFEAAIAAVTAHEAGKHGVTIEGVTLTIRERGSRSISSEVELKARKLFFTAVIHVAADLDLDDNLNAVISGLTCKGEGAIGALACGVLSPHLEKLNGRTFPLLALPLGEIRLRDVRLAATERLTVTALFGA